MRIMNIFLWIIGMFGIIYFILGYVIGLNVDKIFISTIGILFLFYLILVFTGVEYHYEIKNWRLVRKWMNK